jgi:uncharacterized protein
MKKHLKLSLIGALIVLILLGLGLYFAGARKSEQQVANSTDQELPAPEQSKGDGDEFDNPYAIEALAKKEYQGSDLELGRVLEENSVYTRYYITYKSGDLKISGIMNVPKGDGPFPVVILNHGYIDPAIYTNGRGLRREQDYFARNGFVAIHSDYRNHADSDEDLSNDMKMRSGYVEDVINLVLAARSSELAFLDQDRIGMLGHSMGGGIAQGVMVTKPDLVDAYIMYAPVSGDQYKNFERYTKERVELANLITNLYGDPETNPEFWYEISPLNFYDRVSKPVLYQHGTADRDVPISWSEESVAKLKELNKNVTYHTYPGEGHELGPAWGVFMERNLKFLKDNLSK